MGELGLSKAACVVLVFCAATVITAPAQTFRTLASFDGTDGANPVMSLIQGTDGNFYGTTYYGGTNSAGTIFKITAGGTLTTLYNFCSLKNCTDGDFPAAGLVQGIDGNFYGTTGGSNSYGCGGGDDCGTVFKITPWGKLTTLHNFKDTDGAEPLSALVQATDGNFYGTTYYGGTSGQGTVFRITPTGKVTTLYSFCSHGGNGCTDGSQPIAGLVQGIDGKFYGTTVGGGTRNNGTVFKMTPSGKMIWIHGLRRYYNGAIGGLTQGADGDFYATSEFGGGSDAGTVFRITPAGKLTGLYSFSGYPTDGSYPKGRLIQATDGDFYGTTYWGGANDRGTIFKITQGGALTTLHSFDGTDGDQLEAGLVQGTDGNFYGTATYGGSNGNCKTCGTAFSLSTGMGPFVETRPTSGKVGARVIILGNNLTGTTSVTFNGAVATFTVVSITEIKTSVPTGATTGTVQVTTPTGTLNSNVPFLVRQ